MVEFDVVRSADGKFFLFHDGYERHAFDRDIDLRTLPAAEIRELRYRWTRHDAGVTGLGTLLERFRGDALFNVDRSWWYWDDLLPFLDRYDMAGQLVLKSPVEEVWLEKLRRHPVKYPFLPMVRSLADIHAVLGDPGVNLVGVELLPRRRTTNWPTPPSSPNSGRPNWPVCSTPSTSRTASPSSCGLDDHTSVLGDPADGWGRLMEHGADIVQTDWPDLLARYRRQVHGTAPRRHGHRGDVPRTPRRTG